jgi:hypothetical protein
MIIITIIIIIIIISQKAFKVLIFRKGKNVLDSKFYVQCV